MSDWKEHSSERPWTATVSMSQKHLNVTCTDYSDARSRQHRAAATLAAVPGSSLGIGRLREDRIWAEMEDFFREEDGDRHDRTTRAKSHEATGGGNFEGEASPLHVNMPAKEGKSNCDISKRSGGVCSDIVSSGEVGAAESRNIQGPRPSVILSEESHNFLYSDDDGDDSSATPRRRMVSDASNQSDRSTRGVPARITKQRFDFVGAEENVEREENDLEQKRAVRREVFDSFLFSDDESDNLPGRKCCSAEYTGGGGRGCTGNDDDSGGIGHDEAFIPERWRTRGLEEQGKEADTPMDDTFSVDKRGSGERTRGRPGSDSSDAQANLERGKHPMAEHRALTREKNTTSAKTQDSADNPSRPPPRAAVEASDSGRSLGRVSGYNDSGGGGRAPPTSVAASSFPTEQEPVISDGARRGRHDSVVETRRAAWNADGVSSHAYTIAAVGQTAEGNNPDTPSVPAFGVDDGNSRSTPSSSWSPAGLVSQVERAVTSGMDTPPVDQDEEREERAPWAPPTATTTGKTTPPRGRTGWSPAATRQYWKARRNDNKNGSKEAGVTSLHDTYSTGGENSHWEVSKICYVVGRSSSTRSSLNAPFIVSRRRCAW